MRLRNSRDIGYNRKKFEVDGAGRPTPTIIPGVGAPTQVLENHRLTVIPVPGEPLPDPRDGVVRPTSANADRVDVLLKGKKTIKALAPADRDKSLDQTLRIDNPSVHSPADTDCVSCHTAGRARLFTEGLLAVDTAARPDRYRIRASFNASRAGFFDKTNYVVINFGYFGERPAIAERTVNESAAVSAALNNQ